MQNPIIILLACLLFSNTARAQENIFRNTLPLPGCYCLPPSMFPFDEADRHLLPEGHPSAKNFNNPKHWHWRNISDEHLEFGGAWDVKPEYMDSMPDGNGGSQVSTNAY